MWNYYKDETNRRVSGENNNIIYSIKDSKSFDYKTRLVGKVTTANLTKKNEVVIPLKHFSNFWRTLDMPLINCETNLILTWSTLSTQDDHKFLEQLKSGFKRTVKWNKCPAIKYWSPGLPDNVPL